MNSIGKLKYQLLSLESEMVSTFVCKLTLIYSDYEIRNMQTTNIGTDSCGPC